MKDDFYYFILPLADELLFSGGTIIFLNTHFLK